MGEGSNIKRIIREEVNDLDWISNIVSIEVGLCIKFPWGTEGKSQNYTVTMVDSSVAQLKSNDTDNTQLWGRKKLIEKLGDGTITLCHEDIQESSDFEWMEKIDNLSYDYLNGKALEFDPPIGFDGSDEGDYFNHVLEVLNDIGFTTPNSLIDLLEDPDDELTGLLLYNGKMTWTSNIFDDYEYHINHYAETHEMSHLVSGIPTPIVILNGRNLIHLT